MSAEKPEAEIDIITPEQAASILEPKLQELQAEGWIVLVQHDFMARLTRGQRNLDLEVDLLGNLHLEEKALSPEQEMGQIVGMMLLLAIGFIIITIAGILGFLD